MTDRIILFSNSKNHRVDYLYDAFKYEFTIEFIDNCDVAIEKLSKNFEEYAALIIDNPSSAEACANRLIKHIESLNSFMFGIPVAVLSDDENKEKDEEFIGDPVFAFIREGESKKVVVQRIRNSIRFVNSTNFQEFSKMLKALPSLIYLKDTKGRYIFCSQYWHHLANYDDPTWTIRGKTDLDIRANKKNAQLAFDNDMKVVKTGVGTSYIVQENKIDNSNSEEKEYVQIIKEPIRNEKTGEVMGIIAIVNDVTESEVLRRELRKKSITDQLTSAFNRSYFDEYINKKLTDESYPLSIISVDCDGLKLINDQFGHAVGDQYIANTYALLKESLPENSVIFRMGGDEFIAFVLGTSYKDASRYLDKINDNASKFGTDDFDLRISAGLYTMNDKFGSIERCIAMSDRAMYEAKRKKAR